MENGHVAPEVEDGHQGYENSLSANAGDMDLLCPIRYVYNYLPHQAKWLKPQPLSLSRLFAESKEGKPSFMDHEAKEMNSICLKTQAASLPLHTGLEIFRQNKYWRAYEGATRELFELFAQDQHCGEVMLLDKRSMSNLAEDQLQNAVIDTYSRFTIYMFHEADETRLRLVAQSIILIFAFDGKQVTSSWNEVAFHIESSLH